jgi:deazaflavin-dependent oxidoreductase (nitroreductase family)
MYRPSLRLLRLANPFVRMVLDSPAHRLLSGSLLVLEYRGRRSGRTFRIPLMYARDGDRLIALASRPASKQWWRAFRERAPAAVTIEGQALEVEGRLLDGEEARSAARQYLERFPRTARVVDEPNAEVALVAFAPRGSSGGDDTRHACNP